MYSTVPSSPEVLQPHTRTPLEQAFCAPLPPCPTCTPLACRHSATRNSENTPSFLRLYAIESLRHHGEDGSGAAALETARQQYDALRATNPELPPLPIGLREDSLKRESAGVNNVEDEEEDGDDEVSLADVNAYTLSRWLGGSCSCLSCLFLFYNCGCMIYLSIVDCLIQYLFRFTTKAQTSKRPLQSTALAISPPSRPQAIPLSRSATCPMASTLFCPPPACTP